MNMFAIRVELHNASLLDYTYLAERLQVQGIVDITVDDLGNRYKMSPSEYNDSGSATL